MRSIRARRGSRRLAEAPRLLPTLGCGKGPWTQSRSGGRNPLRPGLPLPRGALEAALEWGRWQGHLRQPLPKSSLRPEETRTSTPNPSPAGGSGQRHHVDPVPTDDMGGPQPRPGAEASAGRAPAQQGPGQAGPHPERAHHGTSETSPTPPPPRLEPDHTSRPQCWKPPWATAGREVTGLSSALDTVHGRSDCWPRRPPANGRAGRAGTHPGCGCHQRVGEMEITNS